MATIIIENKAQLEKLIEEDEKPIEIDGKEKSVTNGNRLCAALNEKHEKKNAKSQVLKDLETKKKPSKSIVKPCPQFAKSIPNC